MRLFATFIPALLLAAGASHAQPPAPYLQYLILGDAEVTLSWGYGTTAGVTGYAVRYGTEGPDGPFVPWIDIEDSTATTAHHTVQHLTNGKRYYFQIRAVGPDGASSPSKTLTIHLAVAPTEAAPINDENLHRALQAKLGMAPDQTITQLHLARMGYFTAQLDQISDLAGLEHAVNLRSLRLQRNEIGDVAPLRGLAALTELLLAENQIADVTPLAGLTALTSLDLADNDVADVTPLRGLTALTELSLSKNNISNVAPLAGLAALESLSLSENEIPSVAPLAGLTALTALSLDGNDIADVAPLRGLVELGSLGLANNQIADVAPLRGLVALYELSLSSNRIADVAPLAGMNELDRLALAENEIVDIAPLRGLTTLELLDLANNAIVDLGPLSDLRSLRTLHLAGNRIANVAPLASVTYLAYLYLADNQIVDVAPLAGLESLGQLHLADNRIMVPPSLEGLPYVWDLDLRGNDITNLAPLGRSGELRRLDLADNQIVDLAPLAELTTLYTLELANNQIADISPLRAIPDLGTLDLAANRIADISPLGDLPGLRTLDLAGNEIANMAPLIGLSALRFLYLADNRIAAVPPVNGIAGLRELDLADNAITHASKLIGAFQEGDASVLDLRGNPLSATSGVAALREAHPDAAVLAGRQVPLFPAAGHPSGREGFVRVLNNSRTVAVVAIEAVDDAGVRSRPVRLTIGAGQSAHFNSDDLQDGNVAKGLRGGVGIPTAGDWRLELLSASDIEVLAYIRTADGFLTSVHDVLPRDRQERPYAAIANPGRNRAQRSSLRLINPAVLAQDPILRGDDDRGNWRAIDVGRVVDITKGNTIVGPYAWVQAGIPVGATAMTAAVLERRGLGAGAGKWRLALTVPWWVDAMSLLDSPTGHLTNLSTAPTAAADRVWHVPFFPGATNPRGRGFVRIANLGAAGEALVVAVDDSGTTTAPLTLPLGARQTIHFNSEDWERGNAAKGLAAGAGPPTRGDWRLRIESAADIRVTSFVRAAGGFLTSMHDVVPGQDGIHEVVFFNPGRNTQQVSLLRLANDGDTAATATVTGTDDRGNMGGEASATIPPGQAQTFTAAQLEEGAAGLEGRLGTGRGKWRLRVAVDGPLTVMSLLASPGGLLTNLSTRGDGG